VVPPFAGGSETPVVDKVLAEQWPNWGLYDRGVFRHLAR
jgi:hypothetical protein